LLNWPETEPKDYVRSYKLLLILYKRLVAPGFYTIRNHASQIWPVMPLNDSKKIALIDDDAAVRASTQWLLRSLGFQTVTFASAEDFLNSGDLDEICCVISDVRMPGMSGLELQRVLIDRSISTPMIFITAFVDDHIKRCTLAAGAFGCLPKPVAEGTLVSCIHSAIESRP
jgi:FixJ family two-component response regulator